MADLPILDAETVQGLVDLDRESGGGLLEELYGMFRTTVSERTGQIAQAVKAGDANALEHAAHALKGSAMAVGLSRVAEACLALERAGREAALDGTSAMADTLDKEIETAQEAVRNLLNDRKV